tara:strand:- start:22 stop:210 length:189 start_codon:yes stop_codon:yes gene_type:complete
MKSINSKYDFQVRISSMQEDMKDIDDYNIKDNTNPNSKKQADQQISIISSALYKLNNIIANS